MAGICAEDIGLEDATNLFVVIKEFGSKEFINQLMYQHKNKLSNILLLKDAEYGNNSDSFIQVKHLYKSFWDAESKHWKKGVRHIVNSTNTAESSSLTASYSSSCNCVSDIDRNIDKKVLLSSWIGECFLLHGNYMQEIHSVFGEVDPKICGYNVKTVDGVPRKVSKHFKHLGNRRISNVSVIGRTDLLEQKGRRKTLSSLSENEGSTYKHALQCALDINLICVAREPSPTPLPQNLSNVDINPVRSESSVEDFIVGDVGSITNNTHVLVAKLKRAFRINSYLHGNLLSSICSVRNPENNDYKVTLASDLTNLRRHIENNQLTICRSKEDPLPEYNENSFTLFKSYVSWKETQLSLVNDMILTWCPEYANLEARKQTRFDAFAEHKCLLQKLLKYDLDEKNAMARIGTSKIRNFVLNSDSQCILKEFSLRYGVTETYQHLAHLECLIDNFRHSDWFLGCLDQVLCDVCEYVRKEKEFIVKKEWDLMNNIFERLHVNIKYCFSKIFSIFKRTVFVKGVNYMVLILYKCIKLRNEYYLWNTYEERKLDNFLSDYFKDAALLHYAEQREFVHLKYKLYYEEDADEESDLNATKLRLIQQNMKQNFGIFGDLCKQCPSLQKRAKTLTSVVGKAFYTEYQNDIIELCSIAPLDFSEVDSQLIGLAHRINTLDKDWKDFIEPREQIWRTHFSIILSTGLTILTEYWLKEIPRIILSDDMKILDLKEHTPPEFPTNNGQDSSEFALADQPTSSSFLTVGSVGTALFSQSVGSAFTRVDNIRKIQEELRRGSAIDIKGLVTVPNSSPAIDSENDSSCDEDSGTISHTRSVSDDEYEGNIDTKGRAFVYQEYIYEKELNVNDIGKEPNGIHRGGRIDGIPGKASLNGIEEESSLNENHDEKCVSGVDGEPVIRNIGKENVNGVDREPIASENNRILRTGKESNDYESVTNKPESNVNSIRNGPRLNRNGVENGNVMENGSIDSGMESTANETYVKSIIYSSENNIERTVDNDSNKFIENDGQSILNNNGKLTIANEVERDAAANGNGTKEKSITGDTIGNRVELTADEEKGEQNEDNSDANINKNEEKTLNETYYRKPIISSRFLASHSRKQADENEKQSTSRSDSIEDHCDEIQSLTNISASTVSNRYASEFTVVRYPSNGPQGSLVQITPPPVQIAPPPLPVLVLNEDNTLNHIASSVRPKTVKPEVIKDNYIKPHFINDDDIELSTKGAVMTTHSLSDLLIICSRMISFTKEISDLVLPTPKGLAQPVEKSIQDDYMKLRVNNFGKVLSCFSSLFQNYASVLMSLDVCGSEIYSRYYNNNNEEEGEESGRFSDILKGAEWKKLPIIPGCRHSLRFTSKKHDYKANHCIFLRLLLQQSLGNWELITKEMCYRINNTYTLLMLLPFIQNKAAECLDINLESLLHAMDGGKASGCVYSTQGPSGSSVTYPQAQQLSFELQPCRDFLENIIQIQMKLLISRVMDIFNKLFDHLYSMELSYKKIQEQMSPCLNYLFQQMKFFQHTMYADCLREVSIAIWRAVIDKYHEVLRRLHEPGDDPQQKGKQLYHLLTSQYLMIRESLNLDPRDNELMSRIYEESRLIFFRLQVFLMTTKDLTTLYGYLENSMQIRDIIENRDVCPTVEECYYHVTKMLTNKSKSFTGTEFIKAIADNAKILNAYTKNNYRKTMNESQQKKSKYQRAEIIAKYYVQSGWIICRKENGAQRPPFRSDGQIILQSNEPIKKGRIIGDFFVENDDNLEDDDDYNDDSSDGQQTRRNHSDGSNISQPNRGSESSKMKFQPGSMFSSLTSNESLSSNNSFTNSSDQFIADWTSNNCVQPGPHQQSYWKTDKEVFHVNGIYVFNMTEENRPIEIAGKLYDIMRLRSDRKIIHSDIRKDIRSILGYKCKTTSDKLARDFFRTHGIRNPYLRSFSCFW